MEWFYAKHNQQFGPVSSGDLKQLARSGQLTPDDLVWREGMEQWMGAGRVKGLFEPETPAVPEVAPPAATPKAVPAPAPTVQPTPALQDSPILGQFELPARGPQLSAIQGVFEGSPPVSRTPQRRPPRHLFDVLLEAIRAGLTAQFVEMTARIFRGLGHYGLYAAMGVAAWFGLLALMEPTMRMVALLVLAVIPLLAVLQYVARRFLEALQRLNQATPGRLDSSAVLDCFALLSLFLGTAGLLLLAIVAVQTRVVSVVLLAVAVFVLGLHLAVLAINPGVLRITLGPSGGAGQEALALLACLLKMLTVGLVPVAFGMGVVCGTVQLGYAIVVQLLATKGEALPDLVAAVQAIGVLCGSAILPVAAYCLFLALHLGIDVLRGLVHLADLGEAGEEPRSSQTP